jgi:replicative DNA helicase
MEKQYPYGVEFQDKVTALVLREPGFLMQNATYIDPGYFDSLQCQALIRVVLDYFFDRGGEVPTLETVRVHIIEETTDNPQLREELLQLVGRIEKADMTGISQTAETVVEFGRMRKMETMLNQLIDGVKTGSKPDEMWKLIDSTRSDSTAQKAEDDMDLGANFLNAQEVAMASGLYNAQLKIKTGIATLDATLNGGVGRKEVAIALADTGRGKSTFLINMGAAGLIQQVPIIHFSVTELETTDLLIRYAARLTNFEVNTISAGYGGDKYKQAMQNIMDLYGPNIMAHRVSPGTSVSTLRSFISRFRFQRGDTPALILVDNTDDLSSMKQAEGSYDELGYVYTELKDLAHDFDCAVWCDSQTNRTGSQVTTIRGAQIGDSYKKLRKADVCISINQTDDELESGTCRLSTVKCRRAPRMKQEITCTLDAARMLLLEAPAGGEGSAATPVAPPIEMAQPIA